MESIVSPSFIKQKARQLKKERSISQSQALDEAVRLFGYSNYKHYLNVLEINQKHKEILLQNISAEKDASKKKKLAFSFIQNFKIPFHEQLNILKLFKNPHAMQTLCKKLNLMKDEIESYLFNDFLTDEGQFEIDFLAPNHMAKKLSINNLTYEIHGDSLFVDGNYVLTTECEFELDENDPISKDDRFNHQEFNGSFEIEIDTTKKITIVHSDISTDNASGFTEEEIEDYYSRFPDDDS